MPDQQSDDVALNFAGGRGETVLPLAPEVARERLSESLELPPERRRDAVADVLAAFPKFLEGWAALGGLARDDVEAYAYFRVGYHRGLDALRAAGWGGTRRVRWREPENRGFLSCVDGLRQTAAAIGETDEELRCEQFLLQLDPGWHDR